MKRKVWIALLAGVAAFCCAFGLAACDTEDGSVDQSGCRGNVYSVEAAYAAATELGYWGSLEEFIASISGRDGVDGANGIDGKDGRDGEDGEDGEDGLSSYEIYLKYHPDYAGDEQTWLESLKGADGEDGEDGEDGADGIGIAGVTFLENGELIITYTDGTFVNLGKIPECQHTYTEWAVGLAPDCTSMGYKVRTCTKCGLTDYLFIEKSGHHTEEYRYDSSSHKFYCDDCGQFLDELHSYGADGVCSACGYVADDSLVLSYALNEDGQSYSITGSNALTCQRLIIPDTYHNLPVTAIGVKAFYGCNSLVSVTIEDGINSIGNYAFSNCNLLTEVKIGEGVLDIGSYAFENCASLKSVAISDAVTAVGSNAFRLCTSLESIVIDAANGYYSSLDGVLFNKEQTELICYPAGKTNGTYTVPDSVTTIGGYAFYKNTFLTSVEIGDGVTSISEYVFYGCASLVSVALGDSLLSVGYLAFAKCSSLTDVILPQSLTDIANEAFYGCSCLTNIVIPDSVSSIGDWAFVACTSLISVTIGSGVTHIGGQAFDGCTALTEINFNATACGDLNTVNPVFYNAGRSGDGITVNIGANVTKIPACLFSFGGGSHLEDDVIHILTVNFSSDSVCQVIGDWAFSESCITTIILPESVLSIGAYSFFLCSGLEDVYYMGTADAWAAIGIGSNNEYLMQATVHYYAEEEPTEEGSFWRYDGQGQIVLWSAQG